MDSTASNVQIMDEKYHSLVVFGNLYGSQIEWFLQ